ncbi:hypothetical protein MMPV_007742 [Pyropia vietnamensis]
MRAGSLVAAGSGGDAVAVAVTGGSSDIGGGGGSSDIGGGGGSGIANGGGCRTVGVPSAAGTAPSTATATTTTTTTTVSTAAATAAAVAVATTTPPRTTTTTTTTAATAAAEGMSALPPPPPSSASLPPRGGRPAGANLVPPPTSEDEQWLQRSRVKRDPATAAQTKVVVAGCGSFGTALATVLARNGYPVTLLARRSWVADEINTEHRNPKYLSEHVLPPNVVATTDAAAAFEGAALCVHAVPVQATRAFIEAHVADYPPGLPILCTSKGLEVSSLWLMCELLPSLLGTERQYAFLSGPSFAKEVISGLPTAVVIAADARPFAHQLAAMLSSPSFKVFTSADPVGLEVAGAIKNVIAIAAGMSDGLGLGTNAMAALVTRGCSEMRRIALLKGASAVTLAGLSGVGDTFLTCFGPLSRNRTVGVRLGRGESLDDILASSSQIAEGIETARALERWLLSGSAAMEAGDAGGLTTAAARAAIRYPILLGVAAVLDGRLTPRDGLDALLAMPPRQEN